MPLRDSLPAQDRPLFCRDAPAYDLRERPTPRVLGIETSPNRREGAGMNALELERLHVVYGYGRSRLGAVVGVDLVVPVGTTTCIIGESGSGKSSIAKAIVGLVPISSGEVRIEGRPLG